MKRFTLLLFLTASSGMHAQGDYQLTYFTADYVEITDGEVVAEADWEAGEMEFPLDFTFVFGSTEISELSQTGSGAEWGSVSAAGIDMIGYGPSLASSAGADNPGAPSIISRVTEGNPGERILKIQYKDVAFSEEIFFLETAENRVDFQMWFYEQGGAFEFRFGPSNIVNPNSAYGDRPGPNIYFFSGVDDGTGAADFGGAIAGDPASPVLLGFNNIVDYYTEVGGADFEDVILSGTPAEGQVYRLSTQSVSVTDHEERNFELYPTITQQEVFLRGDLASGMAFRIVNINGSAVAGGVLAANKIDVSGLASGMYLLQIDGTSAAQKFVKR